MRALRTVLQIAILIATYQTISPAHAGDSPESRAPQAERESDIALLRKPLAGVIVEGNEAIETGKIMALIKTQVGQVANYEQIKEDVRSLIRQRWFFSVDVRVRQSKPGPVLVFVVVERPLIQKIAFSGNKKFRDKDLEELTRLKVGGGFDVGQNREALHHIVDHYHDKGYVFVQVTLEKGDSLDDREVTFKIDEGPRVVVANVDIVGNRFFAHDELRDLLRIKPGEVWRPATSDVEDDVVALKRHYEDAGFFDVRVSDRQRETGDRSQVHLEFVINEGVRFKVRHVEFAGNEALTEEQLRSGLRLRPDTDYDQRIINADREAILTQYARLGRIFTKAEEKTRYFEESGYVDLIYEINEDRPRQVGRFERPVSGSQPQRKRSLLGALRKSRRPASDAEQPGLRDIERIVFVGVSAIDEAEIRSALEADFDTCLAAPAASLSRFLETLERQIAAGYQHAGFPDACVEAVNNVKKKWIEVHVIEGARFVCDDVQVTGARHAPIEALVRSLTEDPKPIRILWKSGGPVPFDDFTATRIRERLTEAFAAAGFYSPEFEARIDRNPNGKTAGLYVKVSAEGPRAVLGQLNVTGLKRDSLEDISKHLGLARETPFDSQLPNRLKRRLWESGRYLTIDITDRAAESSPENAAHVVRDLHIKVREYRHAPPLSQELSPAEQTLLKLRDWMERWATGEVDEDLVMTAAIDVPLPEIAVKTIDLRMVLAPRRGQTIVAQANRDTGAPAVDIVFAAYPDKLLLAAPRRRAKLVLPNSAEQRLVFNATGQTASVKAVEQGKQPFRLNIGMSMSSRKKPYASAFEVKAEFSPAFMLSCAHGEQAHCELHGRTWHIRNDGFKMQVDAATGRPIECRFEDETEGARVVVRTQAGALKAEFQNLESLLVGSSIAYDAKSPWKSVVEFFLDAVLDLPPPGSAPTRIESVRALRKFVANWAPPAFGELLEAFGHRAGDPQDTFCIPSQLAGFSYDCLWQPRSDGRKNLVAGFMLPVFRRLVPRTGWLWSVGRDVAMYWASEDSELAIRLKDAPQDGDRGPLEELLLGSVGPFLNLDMRETAGFAGINHLDVEAFHRDCLPLMSNDSWLGRWIISLAASARTLDKSELQVLGELLPAGYFRETTVRGLLALKTRPGKPVEQILPVVLDHVWSEHLRAQVSAQLRLLLTNAVAEREAANRNNRVRPAAGEAPAKK